jgi:hypothetical protein
VITDEILARTTTTVIPLIVSGITASESYRTVNNGWGMIPVVDVHRLRDLVRLLPTVAIEEFNRFLSGPETSTPPEHSFL